MLKVAFPVNVVSDYATYDIQFGNIKRPTHWNTSWDLARFEVWGHKWADISECKKCEHGYGVSLLNDCKYGWDIKKEEPVDDQPFTVMRLTLLRSPKEPDPEVDRGKHCFTYSLYPHRGNWKAGTVRQAYQLNCPLVPVVIEKHSGDLSTSSSFVSVNCENVVVEAVKKAEDNNDTIVRIYDCYGEESVDVTLTFDRTIGEAVECNLMEEQLIQPEAPIVVQGIKLTTSIGPYKIKTFRIRFLQKEES